MQANAVIKPSSRFAALKRDPALRTALIIYLVLRVLTAFAAYWVVQTAPPKIDWERQPIYNLREHVFTTEGPLRDWLEPWYRWDTGWYIHIAHEGYQQDNGSIIFAPLYPLAMRLAAPLVGGDYLLGGLIVSNICCVIMLVLLYKLAALDYGNRIAQQTALLYMIFPTAFYLMAAYTESLFLTLALGAWLAVRHKQYALAGVLAFLASLTRSQGWILALPFAYLIYIEPTRSLPDLRHPLALLKKSPAVIGGPLGTAVYFLGMQLAGLGSVQESFQRPPWFINVSMPWTTLSKAFSTIVDGSAQTIDLANVAAFIFTVVLGVVMFSRMKKPEYWLYIWPTIAFILLRNHDQIQMHGMLRYVIDLFPLFILLALLFQRETRVSRIAQFIYIIVGFALQIFLVTLFADWLWVA